MFMRDPRRAIARLGSMNGSRRRANSASRSTRKTVSIARPATSRIRTRTSIGWCRRVAAGRTIQVCERVQARETGKEGCMPADKLHPDAQRVCEMIIASGRPPIETLTPMEARAVYLASKPILQPDPEPVAEAIDLAAAGPAGPIPLRLYRARAAEPARP